MHALVEPIGLVGAVRVTVPADLPGVHWSAATDTDQVLRVVGGARFAPFVAMPGAPFVASDRSSLRT